MFDRKQWCIQCFKHWIRGKKQMLFPTTSDWTIRPFFMCPFSCFLRKEEAKRIRSRKVDACTSRLANFLSLTFFCVSSRKTVSSMMDLPSITEAGERHSFTLCLLHKTTDKRREDTERKKGVREQLRARHEQRKRKKREREPENGRERTS